VVLERMVHTVLRVLFIGNSLTVANNMPATIQAMGVAAGVRIVCTAIAKPDFSLEDHWNDGEARRAIARGGWTFVVLQQGPSALPASRLLLEEYAQRFDTEIRAAGGKTALLMVWPSSARSRDFPGVSRSYTSAASLVRGTLLPAGDAWRAAWKRDAQLPLYGPDGYHPSPIGSMLAAAVIFERLTGRAPPAPSLAPLSVAERAVVLDAVSEVMGDSRISIARRSKRRRQSAA
jgi:hypothetical protein